jgi:hypothetical protein
MNPLSSAGLCSTHTFPPCASSTCFTIANPGPPLSGVTIRRGEDAARLAHRRESSTGVAGPCRRCFSMMPNPRMILEIRQSLLSVVDGK